MNVPIITLTVEGMKHTVHKALMQHQLAIDAAVQAALDKLCTEERVAAIVQEEARLHIEATLKEEVRHFFNWNRAGRIAIREAVHQRLNEQFPTNP